MPAALLLLRRFLPYIAAGLALLAVIAWYGHRCDQSGYDRAQAQMAAAVRKAEEQTRQAEIESRKRVEAVDRDYQAKLQDLDTRYRDASYRLGHISVRKCPAGGVALSRDPEPAALDNGATGADRFSRDVSSDIEQLLKQADKQTERLIACQAYSASLQSRHGVDGREAENLPCVASHDSEMPCRDASGVSKLRSQRHPCLRQVASLVSCLSR